MSARQVRSLVKKTSQMATTAAAGPMGACIITRHAAGTKDICAQLTKSDCDRINQKLKDERVGFTSFIPGGTCAS
jgi:uncharacterized protein (UPF0254 family)